METITIATLSTILGIVATVIAIMRNSKKDAQSDIERNISVKEELSYISKSVDDIKYDIRDVKTSYANHNDRLIRVEENVKICINRIEKLEEK